MKIELKNFKYYAGMSEETNAFTADVYADGKKIAYAKNDGHGGSTYYHAEPKNRTLLEQAEAYCKSLPDQKPEGYTFVIKMDLEQMIDDLVTEKLLEQDKKKQQKRMETEIQIGVPNGMSYRTVSFGRGKKVPLSQIPRATLQKAVDDLKAKYPNEQILNTNLQALGINI
jgi:hypothetical protein